MIPALCVFCRLANVIRASLFAFTPEQLATVAVILLGTYVGAGVTVTVVEIVLEQLVANVQVAEYVMVVSGATTSELVLSPVDQTNVPPSQPAIVSVVDWPWHSVGLAGVIVSTGVGFTVTVVDATPAQPSVLVTVTE
jgi:hypothetical protein